MLEALLGLLAITMIGLIVALVLLYRRIWLLMGSVECLCSHISGVAHRE
jgi:cytochrome c biogenesis protein ResB